MKKRIETIDILRGIAIPFILLLTHGYWGWVKVPYPIFDDILIRIAYFGTGIFVTFTGTSTFLFVNKKITDGENKKNIIFNISKRALFIFTIPTLISILFWYIRSGEIINIRYLLYWNVFQLIAVSMFAFFLIPFLRIRIRIFLYITLIPLIFLIGHLILFYKIEPILFLASGTDFPFFPYANYILFGLFIGDFLLNLANENVIRYLIVFCSLGIIGVVNWAIWLREIDYLFIESIIWSLSALLIVFSVFYYYFDMKNYEFKFKRYLLDWGRHSFSMFYVVSFLILVIEIFLSIFYWQYARNLAIYEFFIIFGIGCVIIYLLTLLWKTFEYKYGLEWFMRKFADFSFRKEKIPENT